MRKRGWVETRRGGPLPRAYSSEALSASRTAAQAAQTKLRWRGAGPRARGGRLRAPRGRWGRTPRLGAPAQTPPCAPPGPASPAAGRAQRARPSSSSSSTPPSTPPSTPLPRKRRARGGLAGAHHVAAPDDELGERQVLGVHRNVARVGRAEETHGVLRHLRAHRRGHLRHRRGLGPHPRVRVEHPDVDRAALPRAAPAAHDQRLLDTRRRVPAARERVGHRAAHLGRRPHPALRV
jgi:hypothetical protein